MASQISQEKEIQTAHANIDVFLSQKPTSNDVFPEEVIRMTKQLFDYVYDARDEVFKHNWPRPKTEILIAAVIHAACRQCDSQARTFNEIAHLTGKDITKIEKFFFIIDTWLCSMNNPQMNPKVKEKKGKEKEEEEEMKGERKEGGSKKG